MSSLPLGQKHFRPFLYYVLLLVLNLALYWTVLGGWWTIDDPALLRALIEHGVWRQFYDPAVWRAHYPVPAPGVLTPWSLPVAWPGLQALWAASHGVLCPSSLGPPAFNYRFI